MLMKTWLSKQRRRPRTQAHGRGSHVAL